MTRGKKRVIWLMVIVGMFYITSNVLVEYISNEDTYNKAAEIPYNKVGLVLGTGKYLPNGNKNLFYIYRVKSSITII